MLRTEPGTSNLEDQAIWMAFPFHGHKYTCVCMYTYYDFSYLLRTCCHTVQQRRWNVGILLYIYRHMYMFVLTWCICQTDIMTTWWQIRQHSPRWETAKVAIFFNLNAVIKYSCHAFHNTDRIVIQCFQTWMISHMCFTEHAEPDTTASAHWNPYSCMWIMQEKICLWLLKKMLYFSHNW